MTQPTRILIAGVGNELLTDDGIGVHAVRELEKEPLSGITVVAIGTDVLRGLPFLEAADRVLLIDAVRGGQPAGTIYTFDAGESVNDSPRHSLHSLGLREAMRVLSPDCPPPRVTVLGVEPASLTYGLDLSSVVATVLPRVTALAREIIAQWQRNALNASRHPDLVPA